MEQSQTAKFIEENLKTIFAYALSRVSVKEDAEDLTNDIALAILKSADKIKNADAFYGYVWGIAANTYRKFMRQRKRFRSEELDETTPDEFDFTSELFVREDVLSLRREIALLQKEYRECTIAYYYDEMSCAEIAEKFGISLEMVKYYLFKTRKILKEGICMEREFGEKSFKPAPFEFKTIFSGKFNPEYKNLFSRKLPGQILMSAYYTPMTVRELAIELGTASIYLEDEIDLLEKYNLLTETPSGKYQTNLVIFTDDFTNEFRKKAGAFAIPALEKLLSDMKGKLSEIRHLNPICEKLSDERILWALMFPMMRAGNQKFMLAHPELSKETVLYSGATGTNYGIGCEICDGEFECPAFAGYAGIDKNYYATAADFGILGKKNWYFENFDREAVREKIQKTVSGEIEPEWMIISAAEKEKLLEILSTEVSEMAKLYEELYSLSVRLMRIHAPQSVTDKIENIVLQTLFFQTVGPIGAYAVKSGALALPDFAGAAAVCIVCEYSSEGEITTSIES